MTEEGWVNVYSSIGTPATIQQEENEDGYILIHTISVKQREIQNSWVDCRVVLIGQKRVQMYYLWTE